MTATETFEAYRRLGLTNREAELSILIEQGFRNAEIAAELNISETTVKKHIANIFEKLEVNKREQIREKLY
ncbi:MAG: LuxR C-terminal-related transcriptional regulator [Lachnospiraceae bacterium]|nr:LuxR C-terminal-related transcriptional regulator [Lachnospiraceae bacterium]